MNTHIHPKMHPSIRRLYGYPLQLLQSVDLSVGLSFYICTSICLSVCSCGAVIHSSPRVCGSRHHSGREAAGRAPHTRERGEKRHESSVVIMDRMHISARICLSVCLAISSLSVIRPVRLSVCLCVCVCVRYVYASCRQAGRQGAMDGWCSYGFLWVCMCYVYVCRPSTSPWGAPCPTGPSPSRSAPCPRQPAHTSTTHHTTSTSTDAPRVRCLAVWCDVVWGVYVVRTMSLYGCFSSSVILFFHSSLRDGQIRWTHTPHTQKYQPLHAMPHPIHPYIDLPMCVHHRLLTR